MTLEEWRVVPDFPAFEVSDLGRLRWAGRVGSVIHTESGPCGFHTRQVNLPGGGRRSLRVGTWVAGAFLGPRPEGAHVRRINGDPLDDRLANLAYGTRADVAFDAAARARREEAAGAPTHCPAGHRYADSWYGNWGARLCVECRRSKGRENAARNPDAARAAQEKYAAKQRVVRAGLRITRSPCVDCDEMLVHAPKGPPALRCDECKRLRRVQRNRERNGITMQVSCQDCGATVERMSAGPAPQRCEACRHLRKLARHVRTKPDRSPCLECGQPIEQVNGGRPRLRHVQCGGNPSVAIFLPRRGGQPPGGALVPPELPQTRFFD